MNETQIIKELCDLLERYEEEKATYYRELWLTMLGRKWDEIRKEQNLLFNFNKWNK